MGAMLEALRELQDIELQIVDIRRQLTQRQRLVERQAAKLNTIQNKLVVEREALRRAQMDIDAIDVDLKGRTAQVTRLREHLNTVRTNKEYAAVLARLNNEKADASRLESRALQMMETVEAQRKVVAEWEQQEHAEANRLEDLKAQSAQSQQTFAGKLEELSARRRAAAEKLDPKILALFERLSERYDGEVLARIRRTHPRRDEFACDGCHMALSAEHYNALMVRDEVQTCGNCGRMLYIDEQS